MNRIEKSKEKFKQLFGEGVPGTYATDPDFQDILSHFILGKSFITVIWMTNSVS